VQQKPFYQAAYFDETYVHPLGIGALVLLCVLQLSLPRRLAVLPFLLLICFVPCSQRISLAGLDFNFLRILILSAWLRVFTRGENRGFRWLKLDKIVVAWGIVEACAYILLHRNFGAIVYMSGRMLESLGGYFVVRWLVRDVEDVKRFAKAAAWIAVPVAVCFAIEKATGRNWFSVFGGVPAVTPVREGKIRALGAIGNPILAGCFFVALLPYIAALWWSRDGRAAAMFGIVGCLVVIVACASSTPIAALGAAMLGTYMYVYRNQMSSVRWAVVAGMGAIQLGMNRPIWHLMTRIDLVGGSTGWHRFILIDAWVHRVHQWFLLGVKSTAGWGPGLEDITNQYVLESVRGGMGAFLLFMASIVVAFQYVGRLRKAVAGDTERERLVWSVGVAIFVHCMSFLAVSYFAQVVFGWSLSIAMAAGLMDGLQTAGAPARAPVAVRAAGARVPLPTPVPRRRRLLGETS
jgi:hypothetical protein